MIIFCNVSLQFIEVGRVEEHTHDTQIPALMTLHRLYGINAHLKGVVKSVCGGVMMRENPTQSTSALLGFV